MQKKGQFATGIHAAVISQDPAALKQLHHRGADIEAKNQVHAVTVVCAGQMSQALRVFASCSSSAQAAHSKSGGTQMSVWLSQYAHALLAVVHHHALNPKSKAAVFLLCYPLNASYLYRPAGLVMRDGNLLVTSLAYIEGGLWMLHA